MSVPTRCILLEISIPFLYHFYTISIPFVHDCSSAIVASLFIIQALYLYFPLIYCSFCGCHSWSIVPFSHFCWPRMTKQSSGFFPNTSHIFADLAWLRQSSWSLSQHFSLEVCSSPYPRQMRSVGIQSVGTSLSRHLSLDVWSTRPSTEFVCRYLECRCAVLRVLPF